MAPTTTPSPPRTDTRKPSGWLRPYPVVRVVAVNSCCQSLRPVPAPAAVHDAAVRVHSPIEPLHQEVVVFAPDRFAGMHDDRLVQYEVAPAINQREAVCPLAQRWALPPGRAHARQHRSGGGRAATASREVLTVTAVTYELRDDQVADHGLPAPMWLACGNRRGISRRQPPGLDLLRTVAGGRRRHHRRRRGADPAGAAHRHRDLPRTRHRPAARPHQRHLTRRSGSRCPGRRRRRSAEESGGDCRPGGLTAERVSRPGPGCPAWTWGGACVVWPSGAAARACGRVPGS